MSETKAKSIFDFLSCLTDKKTPWSKLSDMDKKAFSPFMINRWLSMSPELIELVNEFQQYTIGILSKQHVYQLYYEILPKKKMFAKYIKGANSDKYNPALIDFVSEAHQVSTRESLDYVDILFMNQSGKDFLIELLKNYGKTDGEIKKLLTSKKD
jgi:hypothetical protein